MLTSVKYFHVLKQPCAAVDHGSWKNSI